MNWFRANTWCAAALVLLIAGLSGCDRGSRPKMIGLPAPDFSIQDSSRTVSLHDFHGKVVVLNFWATWCPPCVEEMPSLVQMQRQMGDKITVLAVSTDEDAEAYRRFIRERNIQLLTVRDAAQKSNALYGTIKFPETYVIDRNGVVRRKFIGPVEWTKPEIISYLTKLASHS